MNNRKIKKDIHGILLLDKPKGISSNAALQRVKHLLNAKKAGHTGSLDPLATGMLPICFGEATKFSQFLLESDKRYRVQVKLGVRTSTGDAEGAIVATKPVIDLSNEKINQVLERFKGQIQQIPPMFSAIKHQGKPLYELARKGLEIERQPRQISIYELTFCDWQEDTFQLDIHCSKGTYVRTIVEDIGGQLGCGALVANLRRLSVTPYIHFPMVNFEKIEELIKTAGLVIDKYLLPIESAVEPLPLIRLSSSALFYMRSGQPVMVPHLPTQGLVRLYSDDGFVGVGEILEDGRVAPRRLIPAPHRMAKAVGG